MAIAVSSPTNPKVEGPAAEQFGRGFVAERILVTGSTGIVGDTGTFTPKFVRKAVGAIVPGCTRSINASTNVITFTAVSALGNGVTDGIIFGYAG